MAVKHEFAYDQYNNIVHINDANKKQNGVEYYLMPNQNGKLILADGEINTKHFRIKSDIFVTINGISVSVNHINESAEHYNAKMKIIRDKYFNYDIYEIHLKDVIAEYTLDGSRYRADLYGELSCGTRCIIEIIITSETSKNKVDFIKENQILTFELYYDKKGNQIFEQFNCFGNRTLEELKKSIIDFKSRLAEDRAKSAWRKSEIRKRFKREEQEIINIYSNEQREIESQRYSQIYIGADIRNKEYLLGQQIKEVINTIKKLRIETPEFESRIRNAKNIMGKTTNNN